MMHMLGFPLTDALLEEDLIATVVAGLAYPRTTARFIYTCI